MSMMEQLLACRTVRLRARRTPAALVAGLFGCSALAQQLITNGAFVASEPCVVGLNCWVDIPPHCMSVSNTAFQTWKVQSGVVPDTEVLPVYCKNCDASPQHGDTVPSYVDLAVILDYRDYAHWDGLFRYFVGGSLNPSSAREANLSFDYTIPFVSAGTKRDRIPFYIGFADTLDVPAINDIRWSPCSGDGRSPVECLDLRSTLKVYLKGEPHIVPPTFEHFEATIAVPEGARWILLGDIHRPATVPTGPLPVYEVIVDNLVLQN